MEFLAPARVQSSFFPQQAQTDAALVKSKAESSEHKSDKQLKDLSRQFESIFISQLFQAMRKTVPKSGFFDSFATDMYQSMLDQEMAGELSKEKGLGLADMLYRQLVRLEKNKNSNEDELLSRSFKTPPANVSYLEGEK